MMLPGSAEGWLLAILLGWQFCHVYMALHLDQLISAVSWHQLNLCSLGLLKGSGYFSSGFKWYFCIHMALGPSSLLSKLISPPRALHYGNYNNQNYCMFQRSLKWFLPSVLSLKILSNFMPTIKPIALGPIKMITHTIFASSIIPRPSQLHHFNTTSSSQSFYQEIKTKSFTLCYCARPTDLWFDSHGTSYVLMNLTSLFWYQHSYLPSCLLHICSFCLTLQCC